MTASGQLSCPLPGSYMAASGQFLVAAVKAILASGHCQRRGPCIIRHHRHLPGILLTHLGKKRASLKVPSQL